MKQSNWLLAGAAGIAITAISAPLAARDLAAEEASDSADQDQQERRPQDIVVIGKSFGIDVGKTITPLKDVPNTVSVIDRERIEEQNLFTLEDALTATNGITVTGVGSENPSYMSRGFAITNYLIDGAPTLAFDFPGTVPDLFAYDRLEVLRGPAGLFSGSGNPAGSINLVRKRPLEMFNVDIAAGAGSWNNFRFEMDVSSPIGEIGGLRAGVMAQDQDQFFDIAHRNRVGGFIVGDVDIGPATTITIGANYDQFKPAIQSGLSGIIGGDDGSEGRLPDISRSTYLGADWNRFDSESWSAFAEIAHRLSDRWTLRASGFASDIERIDIYSYIGNQPITETNGLTNHIAYRGDNFADTRALDINAVGSFPLFGQEQTLIVGADYQASDYSSYYTRLSNYARIDVYNPVSPLEPPLNPYGPSVYYPVQGSGATCPNTSVPQTPAPANCVLQNYGASNTKLDQYGVYGQMRFSPLAGLTLVGGGRLTWWDTETLVLLPTPGTPGGYGIDAKFTPYAGVVFDATDQLNFYASYADSFTPQAAPAGRSRPDGQPVEPLVGEQFEAGSKLSLMQDRLLLSLAAYQITQTNRLFNDPDDPTVVLQIGKVRSRGVEAEASGEILPGWRVNGGYSYTRTKYLEDANPVFEGLPLVPITPKHMVKLFTNYAPVDGPLAGFSLGGGVTWFSETWGGTPAAFNADGSLRTRSSVVRQGGYAVVDLRAGYELNEQVSLSVNVNNLLDREYYSRISSTGRGNYFGSPRSVFATLRYNFQ